MYTALTLATLRPLVCCCHQSIGRYWNEADYYEPNWQTSFWGPNYPKLLAIKRRHVIVVVMPRLDRNARPPLRVTASATQRAHA